MEYIIVPMDRGHIPQIAALERGRCFSTPWSENMLSDALFDPKASFIVAEDGEGGTVLGYAEAPGGPGRGLHLERHRRGGPRHRRHGRRGGPAGRVHAATAGPTSPSSPWRCGPPTPPPSPSYRKHGLPGRRAAWSNYYRSRAPGGRPASTTSGV